MWARTRAFLDPDSGRWNAPGLGNTLNSIRWDQARRQQAVQQAIEMKLDILCPKNDKSSDSRCNKNLQNSSHRL
ncbi:hypothetical protein DXZ20_00005 [Leptolyngbyaceae cyanobacterium CCMR0081]|uniref:Uncharacterized protein n=1 Tax=Adonisia turfae CCMR0081 TaxID=2292702 RepID=A0A6M0REC6_9CYAN|nr:hypothetical protein [Adonisia turfae CCMR0081]